MLELGLFLPTMEGWFGDGWLPRWVELRDLGRLAEAIGFDALFVPDHLIFRHSPYWGIPEGESRGTHEAWTVLAGLAEATGRVRLGPFVACNGFRNPGLLAKTAATLDEIAGGRLILGLGCGSHPPEYAAFGYPYDHRVGRFEEALEIVVPLLRHGQVDFAGRYYTARDCELRPTASRPGGPPIWIAGFQPRMMDLVARFADGLVTAWHPGPAALATPFALLAEACARNGRDPATVVRSVGVIVALGDGTHPGSAAPALPATVIRGTPDDVAERLLAFREAGAQQVVCMLAPRDARGLERFARVIERVRQADR